MKYRCEGSCTILYNLMKSLATHTKERDRVVILWY